MNMARFQDGVGRTWRFPYGQPLLQPRGLTTVQPSNDGLQPTSDGLQHSSYGM